MSCNNCFNGCAETISDQCIKYTGADVPELNITHGDSALSVINSITQYLTPVLDGSGIKPNVLPENFCELVSQYLPSCTQCNGFTLNEILTAIVHAVCNLQEQIDGINTTLNTLNADYTIECLTGVTTHSDTHDIVQAVINKLCTLNDEFNTLVSSLPDTYVPYESTPGHPGINDLIQEYIDTHVITNLYKDRMIPYAAVPWFGNKDAYFPGGVGVGQYEQIYLCTGINGTPDLRGFTLVGTTDMSTAPFNNDVNTNPAISGNPTINLKDTLGSNVVTLTSNQIPAHTHPAVTQVNQTPHAHNTPNVVKANGPYHLKYVGDDFAMDIVGYTDPANANIDVVTTIQNNVTTNSPHNNIQPSYGCYYIMYIPTP